MRTLLLIVSLVCVAAAAAAVQPTAGVRERPLVIAHRGASGYLPEHTIPAIVLAHAQGADYIEQDVVLSRDDVPVVLHDVHIDTVTDVARRFPARKRADGRFYAIDFTVAELKQLAVSERFDPRTGAAVFPSRFPVGSAGGAFQIPTLEEELQVIQGLNRSTGREAGVYPELKEPAWHRREGREMSPIVLAVLARHGYAARADKVYVQCFDFEEVKRIRGTHGYKGRLVQLIEGKRPGSPPEHDRLRTREGLAEVAKVADGIGPALPDLVTRAADGRWAPTNIVADAKALGLEVHPYTFRADQVLPGAGSFEDLLRFFFRDLKVEGGFTDHPDKVVAFLR